MTLKDNILNIKHFAFNKSYIKLIDLADSKK